MAEQANINAMLRLDPPTLKEDHATVCRLLAEFSAKLLSNYQQKRVYEIRVAWWHGTSIALALVLLGVLSAVFARDSFSKSKLPETLPPFGYSVLAITVPVCLTAAIIFWGGTKILQAEKLRTSVLSQEASMLSTQLRDIVHLGSELEEHGNLSSVQKLELRVRLAEAEGILRVLQRYSLNNSDTEIKPLADEWEERYASKAVRS